MSALWSGSLLLSSQLTSKKRCFIWIFFEHISVHRVAQTLVWWESDTGVYFKMGFVSCDLWWWNDPVCVKKCMSREMCQWKGNCQLLILFPVIVNVVTPHYDFTQFKHKKLNCPAGWWSLDYRNGHKNQDGVVEGVYLCVLH